MKENKDVRIAIRMTANEKEHLKQFAETKGLTISEAIRIALQKLMMKEDQ